MRLFGEADGLERFNSRYSVAFIYFILANECE